MVQAAINLVLPSVGALASSLAIMLMTHLPPTAVRSRG